MLIMKMADLLEQNQKNTDEKINPESNSLQLL